MSVFGVSALSAMALHLCLFGFFVVVLYAIFQRLQIPSWCVNVAGVFLLGFTFHDRPDSFAHLLGVLAVYACVRSRKILGRDPATGEQEMGLADGSVHRARGFARACKIGGIYFLVVSIATLLAGLQVTGQRADSVCAHDL